MVPIMPLRIVPAHIAHAASGDMQCRAKLKFPGDDRAARCALRSGHVTDRAADGGPSWHLDESLTRQWRRVGYDTEAMMQPGTAALLPPDQQRILDQLIDERDQVDPA